MRKSSLLFLLLFSFFLASGGEKNTIVITTPGEISVSASPMPHTELHLSVQTISASPVHRLVQKITGENELSVQLSRNYTVYPASFSKTENSLYSKSYLVHIYPSHHFW